MSPAVDRGPELQDLCTGHVSRSRPGGQDLSVLIRIPEDVMSQISLSLCLVINKIIINSPNTDNKKDTYGSTTAV